MGVFFMLLWRKYQMPWDEGIWGGGTRSGTPSSPPFLVTYKGVRMEPAGIGNQMVNVASIAFAMSSHGGGSFQVAESANTCGLFEACLRQLSGAAERLKNVLDSVNASLRVPDAGLSEEDKMRELFRAQRLESLARRSLVVFNMTNTLTSLNWKTTSNLKQGRELFFIELGKFLRKKC